MFSRFRKWGEAALAAQDQRARAEREIDEMGLSQITTRELKEIKEKFPNILIQRRQKEKFAYIFLRNEEGDIAYKRYNPSIPNDNGHWYLIIEHNDPEITGPGNSQQLVFFDAIIDNLHFLQNVKLARRK